MDNLLISDISQADNPMAEYLAYENYGFYLYVRRSKRILFQPELDENWRLYVYCMNNQRELIIQNEELGFLKTPHSYPHGDTHKRIKARRKHLKKIEKEDEEERVNFLFTKMGL